MLWPLCLLWLFLIQAAYPQDQCKSKQTCGECIQQIKCSWCRDPDLKSGRCMDHDQAQKSCSKIEDPNGKTVIFQDDQLNPDSFSDLTLIQPQKGRVSLRISDNPIRVPFTIGQSKQYPLDLYFLLDFSFSMNETISNVANQGQSIISAIKEITKDLRIGIGSFTEKNLAPFSRYLFF